MKKPMINAKSTAKPAASVAVVKPEIIPPKIRTGNVNAQNAFLNAVHNLDKLKCSSLGKLYLTA